MAVLRYWDGSAWADLTGATDVVPAGRVRSTTVVGLSTTETIVPMNVADFLRGGCTLGANSLVVPVAGIYVVSASLGSINTAGGNSVEGTVSAALKGSSAGYLFRDVRPHMNNWFPAATIGGVVSLVAGESLAFGLACTQGSWADPTAGFFMGSTISAHLVCK